MRVKASSSFLVLAAFGFILACPTTTPNHPTKPIELKYYAQGPWAVTVAPGGACCDSKQNKFDLYYPTNLGGNGFMHPILTWGNGTFAVPAQYDYFLRHMASWGFVVIATRDENNGPGQTILDGANFMVQANSDPASIFHNKLNVSQIGSFGHSQGASGAINALLKSAGVIKTVIPIELPAQIWCTLGANCPNVSQITSGSVFFIDGSADIPISPPTQSSGTPGLQSIQAYYAAVPNTTVKVKGTLRGPSHNDVQGQPDCTHAAIPCINGVYGYLGYPTAWFMFQLQADTYAHGAFVNGSGEMFSETMNWEFVASTVL